MQKITHFIDEKHFGDQVLVYKGHGKNGELYFVIVKDRDEIAFFFIDEGLETMYPANSYIDSLGIEIDMSTAPNHLDVDFDIDLSHYGGSKCPVFISELIKQYSH